MFTNPVLKSTLLITLSLVSTTAFAGGKCDDECIRKFSDQISALQQSVAALQAKPAPDEAPAPVVQVPVGAIIAMASNNPPPGGYIEASGAVVNDLTDPRNLRELCGLIRGKYLVKGDPTSTCRVPNLSGRTIVGAGTGIADRLGVNALTQRKFGDLLGEESHILTVAEMPEHSHELVDPGHTHDTALPLSSTDTDKNGKRVVPNSGKHLESLGLKSSVGQTGIQIRSAGGNQAHNLMQPSMVLEYWIKY